MEEIQNRIENLGKETFGQQYYLTEEDYEVIELLKNIYENLNNEETRPKGIIISGPYGTGKTTLVKLINQISGDKFKFLTARQIANDIKLNGVERALYYGKGYMPNNGMNFQSIKTGCLIFDDLGQEPQYIYDFGNKINTMREVILELYEKYSSANFIHNMPILLITTNLSLSQIEERYGGDVKSRLVEMCNFYEYSPKSFDKRELEKIKN